MSESNDIAGVAAAMSSEEELAELINRIAYKDGYFITRVGRAVRVGFKRTDVFTEHQGLGFGGIAAIPDDATPGDVVRTIFGLFRALEEHECREWFKVDGVQVFSPHITFDALMEAGRHIQGGDHDVQDQDRSAGRGAAGARAGRVHRR